MTDEHLRGLERRADDGDVAAGSQLLTARQRAGELSSEGLRLAASLGHRAARAALGAPPSRLSTQEFFAEAPGWGWEAVTRSMVGLVLDPPTARALAGYQSRLYREALAAALLALEAPEDDDARHGAHAVGQVDVPFTFARWADCQEGLYALCAARCAAVRDREDLAWTWSVSLHAMLDSQLLGVDFTHERFALRHTPLGHPEVASVPERLAFNPRLEGILRSGVADWALRVPLTWRSDQVDSRFEALRAE